MVVSKKNKSTIEERSGTCEGTTTIFYYSST